MTPSPAPCPAAPPPPPRCCVRLTGLWRRRMSLTGRCYLLVSTTAWGPECRVPALFPLLPWTLVLLTSLPLNVISQTLPSPTPTRLRTSTSSESPGRRRLRPPRVWSCTRVSCCPTGNIPGRSSAVQCWNMALRALLRTSHFHKFFLIKVTLHCQSQSISHWLSIIISRITNSSECQRVLRHQHPARPQLRTQTAGGHQQGQGEGGRAVQGLHAGQEERHEQSQTKVARISVVISSWLVSLLSSVL